MPDPRIEKATKLLRDIVHSRLNYVMQFHWTDERVKKDVQNLINDLYKTGTFEPLLPAFVTKVTRRPDHSYDIKIRFRKDA